MHRGDAPRSRPFWARSSDGCESARGHSHIRLAGIEPTRLHCGQLRCRRFCNRTDNEEATYQAKHVEIEWWLLLKQRNLHGQMGRPHGKAWRLSETPNEGGGHVGTMMLAVSATSEATDDGLNGLWSEFKRTGARDTAQPADRALLTVRQVRGGQGHVRPAAPLRRGRPDELRHHRAHRRHRAVRAGPQSPLRDLRHPADQGRHHRRVALHRLGAPFGAQQGTGRRAGGHPPGDDAAAHADRSRGRRRARR